MKKFFCFLMSGLLLCQFMTTNVFAAGELVNPDEIVSNANKYEEGIFTIENDSSINNLLLLFLLKMKRKLIHIWMSILNIATIMILLRKRI